MGRAEGGSAAVDRCDSTRAVKSQHAEAEVKIAGKVGCPLCCCTAHAQKGRRGATREFPCFRSARPRKVSGVWRAGQTTLRARTARTIGMCPLDARSKGQPGQPS